MLSHIMHAPQYHNTPTMGLYDCVAGKQAKQATARCVYCPLPCPALPTHCLLLLAAHRAGRGLHKCHTLVPSDAAYLRSPHQPGICASVAPKMRKRPTSCAHMHVGDVCVFVSGAYGCLCVDSWGVCGEGGNGMQSIDCCGRV
jgi:hypothetical protein